MSTQPEPLQSCCPICGEPIRAGENILLIDGMETHVECLDEGPPQAA